MFKDIQQKYEIKINKREYKLLGIMDINGLAGEIKRKQYFNGMKVRKRKNGYVFLLTQGKLKGVIYPQEPNRIYIYSIKQGG